MIFKMLPYEACYGFWSVGEGAFPEFSLPGVEVGRFGNGQVEEFDFINGRAVAADFVAGCNGGLVSGWLSTVWLTRSQGWVRGHRHPEGKLKSFSPLS
jgi:hypothetical protein